MQRKSFIKSFLPAVAVATSMPSALAPQQNKKTKLPPFLQPGDTIGITAPGGYISLTELQPALDRLNAWGYKAKIGSTIGLQEGTFAGSDEQRRQDMQNMLDDENIKAILCARGGYGSVRIVDALDFSRFEKKHKWFIGFSDVTVLLNHVFSKFSIAGIHSKMCNSFPSDWNAASPLQQMTIESIRNCLSGAEMKYEWPAQKENTTGMCSGALIGGNLRTLENLAGSPSSPCTKNCILFVEDTGEYLYSIDRMFHNLDRSGKLCDLAGLLIGGFRIKADDAGDEFSKSLEQIVLDRVKKYNYPVAFGLPVGHQLNNTAVRFGAVHKLVVGEGKVVLTS